jgi:hypothetical protein
MLIDNKFIYLSLPRCASTSFYITCLRNGIRVEHADREYYDRWKNNIDLSLNDEELADVLTHGHETVVDLRKKFGRNYEIIAIRRDRHKRFISLWKHIIDLFKAENSPIKHLKLENLSVDEIIFYKKEDLVSEGSRNKVVHKFIKNNGLEDFADPALIAMIDILISPLSRFHNHDSEVKWFDFDDLGEMEKWVTKKLGKEFKIVKSNGSQHFDCNLKLDEGFILKYNSVYDFYDLPKKIKTIL